VVADSHQHPNLENSELPEKDFVWLPLLQQGLQKVKRQYPLIAQESQQNAVQERQNVNAFLIQEPLLEKH
jgi:hypothetical protein